MTSIAARPSSLATVGTSNEMAPIIYPEAERSLTQRRLHAAWAGPDPAAARAKFNALARALVKPQPGASASFCEGLEETRDGQPARRRRQSPHDGPFEPFPSSA